MREAEFNQLREASWRRKLTPEEEMRLQAYCAIHPEAHTKWEEDVALTQSLERLPNLPVPSNFTSLVLQAVDRGENLEPARGVQPSRLYWWLRQFAPRAAAAVMILTLSGVGYRQYSEYRKAEMANSGVIVSEVALIMPNAEMWQDFDAIQRVNTSTPVRDEELFAALK